jgi:hypothetical protein
MKLKINRSFFLGVGLGICLGFFGGKTLFSNAPQKSADFLPINQSVEQPIEQMTSSTETHDPDSRTALKPGSDPGAIPAAATVSTPPALTLRTLNVDEVDLNRRLKEFGHEKPLRGIPIEQSAKPNGGTFVRESLPGGQIVDREYNDKNALIGERIEFQNGESLYRSYFESGAVKSINLTLPNGIQITVLQDSTGIPTNRTDILPNGDMLASEFNDSGTLTRRWYIKKGQQGALIE